MWWSYGPLMWGSWFIAQIIGFVFMILMMILAFRFSRRRSGMCSFGNNRELENLRKETRELRAEIEALKNTGRGG
jgi:uncharacterized membrane protein